MTTFDITDAFLERLVQRGIVCMAWTQVYDPAGSVVLSALSAAIPLMVLFYMLAIRRAKGHVAAIVGLAVAFVLAVALWGMPFGTAVSSVAYGMANGLFPIVWIVITAVWVYNMTVESGEFEIIKDSLARLTDDRRLQALFIAYAFSCFIEGTAGFGTPVAIAAAMLVGLGFTPLWGAGIALIANTAPVAFGAIGVPLIVAALLLEVPLVPLCDDDCKGLCPQCGANLNEGPCGCSRDEADVEASPFAALKNFDFGDK